MPGPWRLALGALLAIAGAATILLLTRGEPADGDRVPQAHWGTLPASPLARTEVGAARIGRYLYALGGVIPPDGVTTGQVARYDIVRRSWGMAAPMPIGVNHPAVAVSRGRVFVYGGYTDLRAPNTETDALQRYDPATDSWTILSGSGVKRAAATLAAVDGRLYAIGGASGGEPQRFLQVYDIRRGSWRSGPPMRVAREHLASAVIGGRIFVLGGRAAGGNLDVVESFDPATRKWRRLPHLHTARSGFGVAVVGGRLIALGGEQLSEGDRTISPVESYDPAAKRWRRLPPMLTPRHGLGVASRGLTVFAAEGGPQPGLAFSDVLESLRVPRPR
jgi:hypothetical protein